MRLLPIIKFSLIGFVAFTSTSAFSQTNNTAQSNGNKLQEKNADTGEWEYVTAPPTAGGNITSGDFNTFFGAAAGYSVSSGLHNVMIGNHAGRQQTSAADNVFIGAEAGFSVTTGTDNTFIGTRAGYSSTATDNTFIGTQAGQYNTTGYDNTFVGEEAGRYNTTGQDNTFIGEDAGYNNTTGRGNTFVGSTAGRTNTEGRYNTAVGNQAGYDLATRSDKYGARNTMVGTAAGEDISNGVANTMIGDNAGPHTEYAHFNTFVGFQAGYDNNRTNNTDQAHRNVALGAYAGYTNREGSDNVWIGTAADSGAWGLNTQGEASYLRTATAWSPGTDNVSSSGADNTIYRTTVMGSMASAGENDSIAIGYSVRADKVQSTVIGYNATGTGTGDLVIGHEATNNKNYATVIGHTATGNYLESITIGYGASAHADRTVVLGNDNTVSWDPHSNSSAALGQPVKCGEDADFNIVCDDGYRFSNVYANVLSAYGNEATSAQIDLFADDGDDNADKWSIAAADDGLFSIATQASGSAVQIFKLANNGDGTLEGNLTVAGNVTLNSDERLKKNIKTIPNAGELLQQLDGKTYHWKSSKDKNTQYGLIAQQVQAVIPELVTEKNDGMLSVNYQGLVPVLLNGYKEQQKQIDALNEKILRMEQLMDQQARIIESLDQ